MHPGAGSPIKRWPPDRYIRLAEQLELEGSRTILVIEGPAEGGTAKEISGKLAPGKVMQVESAPLALVAALLERCESFVGNDSGVAHLAAGLGVPSVVLFGPSLPQHWAPLGEHVTVLRDARGCEGCASGRGGHTCLRNISMEEVLRSIRLNRRG
jgi:ADP-heptose:LPS heptosyltransferase